MCTLSLLCTFSSLCVRLFVCLCLCFGRFYYAQNRKYKNNNNNSNIHMHVNIFVGTCHVASALVHFVHCCCCWFSVPTFFLTHKVFTFRYVVVVACFRLTGCSYWQSGCDTNRYTKPFTYLCIFPQYSFISRNSSISSEQPLDQNDGMRKRITCEKMCMKKTFIQFMSTLYTNIICECVWVCAGLVHSYIRHVNDII